MFCHISVSESIYAFLNLNLSGLSFHKHINPLPTFEGDKGEILGTAPEFQRDQGSTQKVQIGCSGVGRHRQFM